MSATFSYIHPENQQLLWSIVNSHSILTETFAKYTPVQKEEWFKSVIELFYKKIGDIPLTKTQLHQHNKETLAYMIQLCHRTQYAVQQEQQRALLSSPPVASRTATVSQPNRDELYTRQFQEREREYKSMLETKAPEPVDFREKEDDTAITNMEELIRRHQAELQSFRPPPLAEQKVDPPIAAEPVSSLPAPEWQSHISVLTQQINLLKSEIEDIKQSILSFKHT